MLVIYLHLLLHSDAGVCFEIYLFHICLLWAFFQMVSMWFGLDSAFGNDIRKCAFDVLKKCHGSELFDITDDGALSSWTSRQRHPKKSKMVVSRDEVLSGLLGLPCRYPCLFQLFFFFFFGKRVGHWSSVFWRRNPQMLC